MKLLLIITALLAGCAGLNTNLQHVTAADVDAAIQLAQQANDAEGVACWQAVRSAITASWNNDPVEIKGSASALQEARNVRRAIQDPVVHRNCAVVVLDATETAARIGLRVGTLH
jgi:hypothetical protein